MKAEEREIVLMERVMGRIKATNIIIAVFLIPRERWRKNPYYWIPEWEELERILDVFMGLLMEKRPAYYWLFVDDLKEIQKGVKGSDLDEHDVKTWTRLKFFKVSRGKYNPVAWFYGEGEKEEIYYRWTVSREGYKKILSELVWKESLLDTYWYRRIIAKIDNTIKSLSGFFP